MEIDPMEVEIMDAEQDRMSHPPVLITNPHPLVGDGRLFHYGVFLPNETVGEYLIRHRIDIGRGLKSVFVNGERIDDAMWPRLIPATGDQIVIRSRAAGGNGGKVLRVVAMAALAITTAGYGTSLGLAMGLTGSTATMVGSSLIMIGGSLLLNALLPPIKPQLAGTKEKEQSPTYGISAGSNSYNAYGPMIVVFGRHKVVPYFASKPYTTFAGNDQYLSQAFHFGLQPDLDLSAIRIGATDISSYQDVELNRSTYDGKLSLIAGNVDTLEGFEVPQATGWIARTTPRETEHISVDVAATLYRISDEGDEEKETVQIEAQYRAVGSEAWLPLGGQYETRATHYWSCGYWTYQESAFGGNQVWQQVQYGSMVRGEHTDNEPVQICHDRFVPLKGKVRECVTYTWRWVGYGILPWQGRAPNPVTTYTGTGVSQLVGSDAQKPARVTVAVAVAAGQYEVRFRKLTPDIAESRASNKVTVAQIRCVQTDKAQYLSQCRLAVRIKATSQLNGAIDKLSAIASAKTLIWQNNAWVMAHTSNPAWWFLFWARGMRDADFNRLYGECLPDIKIDLEAIKSWAAWCEAKGLTFNWVLDRKMSIEDVYYVIARAGRASKTLAGGKLSVIWDSADIPVTNTVTPANMIAGSYQYTYINTEVADEIVINFFNEDKDWEADVVRQRVPGAPHVNNPITLDLEGCTVAGQAGREANLLAASQVFHRKQHTWEMDIEGTTLTRGDVVRLTHDLNSWGASGRLLAMSANGRLTLDAPVQRQARAWLSIRTPDNQIAYVRVSPTVGGADDQVTDQLTIDGGWPKGLPPIEGEPLDYLWQYHPKEIPGRPLQIKSVKPSGKNRIKFEAIEYSRQYHESESDPYIHVPAGSRTRALINVFSITGSERIVDEVTGRVELTFTWVLSEKSDSHVHLYVNGDAYDSYVTARYMTSLTAVAGDVINIEVRPVKDDRGIQERYQYVVKGTKFNIPAIELLKTTPEIYGIRLDWVIPPVNYIQRSEIFYAQDPKGQTAQKLTDLAYPQQTWQHAGLRAGQTYYYWVRIVDRFGNVGPLYPVGNGVRGTSSIKVSDYTDLFKTEFLSSDQGKALLADIARIDGSETLPGSIDFKVKAERERADQALNTAKKTLAVDIAAIGTRLDSETGKWAGATNELLTQIAAEGQARLAADQAAAVALAQEIAERSKGDADVATRQEALQADYQRNAVQVSQQLSTLADGQGALGVKIDQVAARSGSRPNLLKNGGFTLGLDAWSGPGYWDVVDDPILGRYVRLKGKYLSANGSQVSAQRIDGVAPGQVLTLSGDWFNQYSGNPRSGYAGASLQFVDGAGNPISNHPISGSYLRDQFDDSQRGSVTVVVPEGAVAVYARFYKNGAGTNLTALGVSRLKLELGDWASPYSDESGLPAALAAIKAADTARTEGDAALSSRLVVLGSAVADNKAAADQSIKTLADADQAQAQAHTALQAQLTGGYTGSDPKKLTAGLLFEQGKVQATETAALAESQKTLTADLAAANAAMVQEQKVRAEADAANASTAAGLNTRLGKAESTITAHEQTRAAQDKAIAQRMDAHVAAYDQAMARVDGSLVALAAKDEAITRDLKTAQSELAGIDARARDEVITRSRETEALAGRAQTLESRIAQNPNLLKNGGFEDGTTGWSGAIWDVVDDSVLGRYVALKANYLSASGSQVSSQRIDGIAPGQTFTLSADFFNTYSSDTARSGYAGASLQFVDAAGTALSNTTLPGSYAYAAFDRARRFMTARSATAPEGTTGLNVRIYKLGTGQNLTALAIARVKLELGSIATPYSSEAGTAANVAAVRAAIDRAERTRAAGDEALGTQMQSLSAVVDKNKASADQSIQVLAQADAAMTQSLIKANSAIADVAGDVKSESTTRASETGSLAQDIKGLKAEVTANQKTAQALVDAEAATRASADEAAAQQSKTLKAQIDSNKAQQDQFAQAVTDATQSLFKEMDRVTTVASTKSRTLREPVMPTQNVGAGDIWFDTANGNKAYRHDGVKWEPMDDARIAQNAADMVTERQVRATAVDAIVKDVKTLQVNVNGAQVSTQATATALATIDGRINASYSLKTQVIDAAGTRVATGFGATVESAPGGVGYISGVNVWADRFAVWAGQGTQLFTPFTVANGQVFIDSAVIRDMSADKLTGGTFNVGGANGYGCLRTTGRVFADQKPGFFLETLENGDASVDLVGPGARLYMSRYGSGLVLGNGAFQAYSDGNVVIGGNATITTANIIKRLNIAGNAVTTMNVWSVPSLYNGESNLGQVLWSAALGNETEASLILTYDLFRNSGNARLGMRLQVNGNDIDQINNGEGVVNKMGRAKPMVIPAWSTVALVGGSSNGDSNDGARIGALIAYR